MCFKNICPYSKAGTELGVGLFYNSSLRVDFINPHFTDKEGNGSLQRLRNLQANEWSQLDSEIYFLSFIPHCPKPVSHDGKWALPGTGTSKSISGTPLPANKMPGN